MALGYPVPSLVQLNSLRAPGHTLLADINAKIEAINCFHSGRDNDLMLLMDSSDAWFQLRPQVMLSRYYKLKIATVNAQSVLLPGEDSADNGVGGELADLDAAFGTIGALRNLLSQAKDAVVAEPQLNSTYKVFSHIVRKWQNKEASRTPAEGTTSKESASAFRVLFDMSIISSADSKLVKRSTPDATMEELHSARPPFWSMMGGDLAQKAPWEQRPLRMNSQRGVVPAIVMHDSRDQWVKTWFSRSLVPLYVAQRQMPLGPVAFAGGKYWWPHRHALEPYEIITMGSRSYLEADEVCAGLLEETLSGR